ncbi:hypothetical protein BDV95DRAFT_612893 [Massariosphaeria phaeospora]|uniref:Uncharacterized protein n=1 Tax=Massariosphaeria phaeospora TaxID=100035 RepID=A0A7C8MEH9_9PLEO|nr:hypothetical protein BDV95DRAFT_612893 [Massariosphaeria phaeospora]
MSSTEDSSSAPFFPIEIWKEEIEGFGDHDEIVRPSRPKHLYRSRSCLVVTFLFVLLLGLVCGYTLQRQMATTPHSCHNDTLSMTFLQEPIYSEPPSDGSDAACAALIPLDRGFVEIDTIEAGTNSPGRYCVSVFHQLHCLNMLRQAYYGGEDEPGAPEGGVSPLSGDFYHHPSENRNGMHAGGHAKHCFDYLRQALLCVADSTLEERSDKTSGVKGVGTTRQCRDFEALKAWTENHRYSDEDGIVK